MSKCPRVQRRIECRECEYPYSEACYGLEDVSEDPGHVPDEDEQ